MQKLPWYSFLQFLGFMLLLTPTTGAQPSDPRATGECERWTGPRLEAELELELAAPCGQHRVVFCVIGLVCMHDVVPNGPDPQPPD